MSTFEDLERDQLNALVELTETLDLEAGLHLVLAELGREHDVKEVASVLELDAGAVAALNAAGLPVPDELTATPREAPSQADVPGAPEGHQQLEGVADSSPNRRSRTVFEISQEITLLLALFEDIYDENSRGRRSTLIRKCLLEVDTARLKLAQVQTGLGTRQISLVAALKGLDEAAQAVRQASDNKVRDRRIRVLGSFWAWSSAVLGALSGVIFFGVTGPAGFGAPFIASTAALVAAFSGSIQWLVVESKQKRRLWRARTELIESNTHSRIVRLSYDVRRLFDAADEFSAERTSL